MDLNHATRHKFLWDARHEHGRLHGAASRASPSANQLTVDVAQRQRAAVDLGLDDHRGAGRQGRVPVIKGLVVQAQQDRGVIIQLGGVRSLTAQLLQQLVVGIVTLMIDSPLR